MGLRAGPLSDDAVIERISTMFIPVAVNLYEIREDRGPAGDLFRSVQQQMDQYQGFWLVSPDGKALAKKHEWIESDPANYPKELLAAMNEVLRAFDPLSPREATPTERFPYRGMGVRPDGTVTLALYGRLMHQGQPDGPMMLDKVTLDAAEWASFTPATPIAIGQEWTLPESVARKVAGGLAPGDSAGIFRPEDFLQATLTAKVMSLTGPTARIELAGEWKAAGFYGGETQFPFGATATAEGIADFDVETNSMRSLLVVFSGTFWRGQSIVARNDAGRETGSVIEWRSERHER